MDALTLRSGAWRNNAACRTAEPELFFPIALEKGFKAAPAIDAAKEFCDDCPVRVQCGAEALARGERWGIWGGLTPAERRDHHHQVLQSEQFPPIVELVRELPGIVPGRVHPRGRPRRPRPRAGVS